MLYEGISKSLKRKCSVLFGKVLDQCAHRLTSKSSINSIAELPTWPVQRIVEEEKVLVDFGDIANQRPP